MSHRLASLLLLSLCAVACTPGCKDLDAKAPDTDKLKCQAKALEPLVGSAFNAAVLVKEIQDGKRTWDDALSQLFTDRATVRRAYDAVKACDPQPASADAGASDGGAE